MKDREVFLDKMRVAAACAVVLLHTVTGVLNVADMSQYPLENKIFLILTDLSCWCVPVFLLISGYLFLNPARKIGIGKMLTRYCRRVALALLLFGVPYACLELIVTQRGLRWGMLWESFLMVLQGKGWSHMWYLYLILFLYLLTPGLKWVLSCIPKQAVYIVLGVLLAECSIRPFLFRLFELEVRTFLPEGGGIYLLYYLCGYLFAERKNDRLEKSGKEAGSRCGKRKVHVGNCLPALSVFLVAVIVCRRLFQEQFAQVAYNDTLIVGLSLALFGWAFYTGKRTPAGNGIIPRGKFSRGNFHRRKIPWEKIPWEKLADLSFAIYLVHPGFLNMSYKFFHITPLSFPLGISLPVFFLGTLLLAAVLAWALRKIPPLKKYVL